MQYCSTVNTPELENACLCNPSCQYVFSVEFSPAVETEKSFQHGAQQRHYFDVDYDFDSRLSRPAFSTKRSRKSDILQHLQRLHQMQHAVVGGDSFKIKTKYRVQVHERWEKVKLVSFHDWSGKLHKCLAHDGGKFAIVCRKLQILLFTRAYIISRSPVSRRSSAAGGKLIIIAGFAPAHRSGGPHHQTGVYNMGETLVL